MLLKASAVTLTTTALFGSLLYAVQPLRPAEAAQFIRCTTAPVSVQATGHGILGVDKRVTRVAIDEWQQAIYQSLGPQYADWTHSLGAQVSCHRELFEVNCVAIATPCHS
jgi:hypothetical protein